MRRKLSHLTHREQNMEQKRQPEDRQKRLDTHCTLNSGIWKLPASFTIEASLLMTILLPILLALIYYGFYCHDRGVLQSASCEVTAMADNLRDTKNAQNILNERAMERVQKRTVFEENAKQSVILSDENVTVTASTSIPLPGFISGLFSNGNLKISETQKRKLLHPARIIRKIRGAEYLLKGEEEQ